LADSHKRRSKGTPKEDFGSPFFGFRFQDSGFKVSYAPALKGTPSNLEGELRGFKGQEPHRGERTKDRV